MKKKVLIISTTRRKNGNSDVLAKEFERGAIDAGHEVEYVSLVDKSVNFCIGCFACSKTEKCFMDDDASAIVFKLRVVEGRQRFDPRLLRTLFSEFKPDIFQFR